jgi:precorrin-8X/cobalt-precorrin-8 methylmutase
VQRR